MKKLGILGVLFAILFGVPLLMSDKAGALANTEPEGSIRFAVGGIGGQFNSSMSVSRLYVPIGSTGSVTIHSTNPWNIGTMSVYTVGSNNACQINVDNRVGSVNPDNDPRSPSEFYTTLGGINNTTYEIGDFKTYCVVVNSTSPDVARFKLTAGTSQLIGNDVSANSGTTGYVGSDSPNGSQPDWSKTLDFTPSCDVGRVEDTWTGTDATIWFYDLDLQESWQDDLTMTVQQTPAHQGFAGGLTNVSGTPVIFEEGTENETKSVTLSFNDGGPRKYRLRLTPIAGENAIKIALPYDQIYNIINCPVPNHAPSGTLSISCNADIAKLTIRTTVSDSDAGAKLDVAATASGASPSNFSLTDVDPGTHTLTTTAQGGFGSSYTVTGSVTDDKGNEVNLTSSSVTCPALHWVTGTVRNAYNPNQTYGSVDIQTCRPAGQDGHADSPSTATTDSDGYFAFRVPHGRGFCVRLSSVPSDVMSRRIRPRVDDYRGCGPFSMAVVTPNYCTAYQSYERQISNRDVGGYDRSTNNYYDFALRFRPAISCAITSPGIVEAGASYDPYIPTVTVTKEGGSVRPDISSGVVTLRVQGRPNQTWTHSSSSGSPGLLTSSRSHDFDDVVISEPGTYTVNASVTAVGDGYSIEDTRINCPSQTLIVGTRPYLKEFGGDVWSGGAITSGADCTAPDDSPGNIFAFNRGSAGSYMGSSAQLTITALMSINGFASAGQRSSLSNTIPPKGLSFANNNSAEYGGEYGAGAARCITDYFTETRASELDGGNFNGTLPSDRGRVQYESGAITVSGLSVPLGTQAAVYADGNVYITGNIEFATGASRLSDMPYFALIVRGNIYIDPSVTRIDGLFVAQPRTGASNSGVVYTCATSSSRPCSRTNVLEEGDRQLAINGSLVAQRIKWLRTYGSLAGATNGELPNFATGHGTNAAEVVNYTPELYLAPSPLELVDENGARHYDAIRSLPPVL